MEGVSARTPPDYRASGVLPAAAPLFRTLPAGDPVTSDYQDSLTAFRRLVPGNERDGSR